MNLVIDTGAPDTRTAIDYVPDWQRDICDGAPPPAIVQAFALHLIGTLQHHGGPKLLKTVRSHVLFNWAFLRALADESPELFDEFWRAYAARSERFD